MPSAPRCVQGGKCGTSCSSLYLVRGSDPGPAHRTTGAGSGPRASAAPMRMSNFKKWAAPEPCQLSSGTPDGLFPPVWSFRIPEKHQFSVAIPQSAHWEVGIVTLTAPHQASQQLLPCIQGPTGCPRVIHSASLARHLLSDWCVPRTVRDAEAAITMERSYPMSRSISFRVRNTHPSGHRACKHGTAKWGAL